MHSKEKTESIRAILEETRHWFGLPPIRHRGDIIDGRIRFREAVALRITIPKAIECRTDGEAARMLCAAQHYERAFELIPVALRRLDDACAFCGTSHRELIAPMFAKKKAATKWKSKYANRRAIEQMARLLQAAELGTGTVTATQIREVLSPWL